MSTKLAGTSLLESGTEDRPFDGQEFHIFSILETPKNCRALCSIDCFLILHAASPRYNLRSRRCCININKNVLLNKQVLHVNLSIFIVRRTITKGLVTNDGIDSWAVTVYE